jgi:hypothetical protein
VVLSVLVAQSAFAVHDETFQLDGDVLASTTTTIGGTTQTLDWDSLFDANGDEKALPAGFTASAFNKDFLNTGNTFITSDDTTFATGSKDTLPITPGWQCNHDSNVNSKIDIMNSYSAAFNNADGDEILYFALERNTNTGDANVGFWFLQDQVGCTSPGGSQPFTGDHLDGDLLIVSAFTNGGTVSTIDVYRWNRFTGTCLPTPGPDCVINPDGVPGSLNTTPVAHGVDCRDPLTGLDDTACAVSNRANITTPWLTASKQDGVGHILRTSDFFEGGLNLTQANLGGRCFNTFLGDTRSSQSLTATLFDYSLGTLGECSVSMTTAPSQTTRQIDSTDPITDTATVVGETSGGGTAPTPTGTVDFFLCAPSELTTGGVADPDGVCEDANGTAVPGNPVTVTESAPGTATAESGDAQSLITGIGKYCFRATFTADPDDPNYPGQAALTDNLTEECFTVTGSSGLATAQDWLPNDTATLTGDSNLNGTLTFQLYTGTDCEVTGTAVTGQFYSIDVVDAAPGSTFNTSNTTFKVNAGNEGSYSWRVIYDDDTLADPVPVCETSTVAITD